MSRYEFNGYLISDDKSLLSTDRIMEMLSNSYWASNRSREVNEMAIENSICYGAYFNNHQVGYARVVTDNATMYWLCDVIIDEEHRNKGLGKKLIEVITNCDKLKGKLGILLTKDAHKLYDKYGFISAGDGAMVSPRK